MFDWIKRLLTKIKQWIMGNYANLISTIQNEIKENHEQYITGPKLQDILKLMVQLLGQVGFQFMGFAETDTDPGTPDYNAFYIAGSGVYPNFGPATVDECHIGIFMYNGSGWEFVSIETGFRFEYSQSPDGGLTEFMFEQDGWDEPKVMAIMADVSNLGNPKDVAISAWWAARAQVRLDDIQGFTIEIDRITSSSPHTIRPIETGKVIDGLNVDALTFDTINGEQITVHASDLPYTVPDTFVRVRSTSTLTNVVIHVRGQIDAPGQINLNLEDLNFNELNQIQFANRVYNSQTPDGMGYVILRKDRTFAEQIADKPNTIFEIRYDFDLGGNTINLPDNIVLKYNGGSLRNGNIECGNNIIIDGHDGLLYKVRVIGNSKNNISIKNIHLTTDDSENIKTPLRFVGCNNILMKDIVIDKFLYSGTWVQSENSVIFCDNCNNILIDNFYNVGAIYQDGPFFKHCTKLYINNMKIDDKDVVTYKVSTNLNVFFCTNVIITNCYFYHSLTSAASVINLTANKALIANCQMWGGFGIDVGNEADENFESEEIRITNCLINNSKFALYGTGTDQMNIKNLIVDNCNFYGLKSQAFSLSDQIENIKISNCIFDFEDGRTLFYISHNDYFGVPVSIDISNIKVNIIVDWDAKVFTIDSGVVLRSAIITNSKLTKANNTTYTNNYIAFCDYQSSNNPDIIFDCCELLAPRYDFNLFQCAGNLIIKNSKISTYNNIAGQSGQILLTRNINGVTNPNNNIIIKDNILFGISFRIINTQSKIKILNNIFGASVAGNSRIVTIVGDGNDKEVSNLMIVGNQTQDTSISIYNSDGVFDNSVIIRNNNINLPIYGGNSQKPTIANLENGYRYYNSQIDVDCIASNGAWVDSYGHTPALHAGLIQDLPDFINDNPAPTSRDDGFQFFLSASGQYGGQTIPAGLLIWNGNEGNNGAWVDVNNNIIIQ